MAFFPVVMKLMSGTGCAPLFLVRAPAGFTACGAQRNRATGCCAKIKVIVTSMALFRSLLGKKFLNETYKPFGTVTTIAPGSWMWGYSSGDMYGRV